METHPSLKMKPERRAALFRVATQEFTDFGFEQASLNRIIGEVGMSKSSFYHYFTNKTELFQQIMRQTLETMSDIADALEPEALTEESFWPMITEAFQSGILVCLENPEIFKIGRMFHRNLAEPSGICTGLMEAPMALLTRVLEHGKEIGVIRDDLPSSLLLESVLALGMAIDRWAIDNAEHYSPAEFSVFNGKIINMFKRILAPEA